MIYQLLLNLFLIFYGPAQPIFNTKEKEKEKEDNHVAKGETRKQIIILRLC